MTTVSSGSERVGLPIGRVMFVFSADTGDHMVMDVDYGDTFLETFRIRFHNNMPNITHWFNTTGCYEPVFDLYGPFNLESQFFNICLAEPILYVNVSTECSLVNEESCINITVEGGTDITILVDWGDGTVDKTFVSNYTELSAACYTHTYTAVGTWSAVVAVTNAVSNHTFEHTLYSAEPITGLTLTPDNNIASFGGGLRFTRTLQAGSPLTCTFDHGDGSAVVETSEATPQTSPTIMYGYTTYGDHHYNYTCWNCLSSATVTGTIYLNEAVTGVVPDVVAGGTYSIDNDLVVGWTFATGKPAYFNCTIGSIEANTTSVNYSPKTGVATFLQGALQPGTYQFYLKGENALTPSITSFSIDVDYQVTGATFDYLEVADDIYVPVGKPIRATVSQAEGSRPTDIIKLDGDDFYSKTHADFMGGADERNLSIVFVMPGPHLVSLQISNGLGSSNATKTYDVFAQIPLDNTVMDIRCDCIMSTEVEFCFTSTGMAPDLMVLDIDFGDGSGYYGELNLTTGGACVSHTYPAIVQYSACVRAFNNVSMIYHDAVEVDVAEQISNLTIDIPTAIEHKHEVQVDVLADSGSCISVTVDWGDDNVDVQSCVNATDLQPMKHTYATVGDFNVSVRAENTKSYETKSRIVQIDEPISGYARVASNSIAGSTHEDSNWFNTSANGSRINLFVDPDTEGGDSYVYDFCFYNTSMEKALEVVYDKIGVYIVTIYVSNSLGRVRDQFTVARNDPVENFSMEGPETGMVGEELNYTLTVTGSHITTSIQFGEGDVLVQYNETHSGSVVYFHSWNATGVYNLTTCCYNYVSEECDTKMVYIQDVITGFVPFSDMFIDAAPGSSLHLNFSIDSGTDVTAVMHYGNMMNLQDGGSPFFTWDGAHGELLIPYPLHRFGVFPTHIKVCNKVSCKENNFTIAIDERLTNIICNPTRPPYHTIYENCAGSPSDDHVASGVIMEVTVTAGMGTSSCIGVDFGDVTDQVHHSAGHATASCTVGVGFTKYRCGELGIDETNCQALDCCYDDAEPDETKCFHPDLQTGPWSITANHTYDVEGDMEIAVSIENGISNFFCIVEVSVEHPVAENLIAKNVNNDQNYTFAIGITAGHAPSYAMVEVDFGDGTPNLTEPLDCSLGSDHLVNHFLLSEQLYHATIVVWNNVSCRAIPFDIAPELECENVTLVLAGPQLPGDTHNLTLGIGFGYMCYLSCDWGDGSPLQEITVISYDEIPLINHTYPANASSYSVICNVTNKHTDLLFEHVADVDEDILGCDLPVYSHISLPDDGGPPFSPTVFSPTVTNGTRMHVVFSDSAGNAVYYQAMTMNEVTDLTITYTGTAPVVHNCKMDIFNTRTLCELNFVHAIQYDFRNVKLDCNEATEVAADPVAEVVVSHGKERLLLNMTGGGKTANLTIDLGNGEIFNETNLAADAHEFNYTFLDYGTYEVSYNLTNYVDDFRRTCIVHVQDAIENLTAGDDVGFEFGGPLVLSFNWTGTNSVVVAHFGATEVPAVVDYETNTGNVTIPEAEYNVGTHTFTVNVSNYVNSQQVSIIIDIDYMISELSLTSNGTCIPVGDAIAFDAHIRNGTRFSWFFDFDDPGDDANRTIDDSGILANGEHSTSVVHAFETFGYRYVTVSVGNALTTLIRSIFVCVEYPVNKTEIIFIHPDILDRPSVAFTVTMSLQPGANPPSGFKIEIDYGDGNISTDHPVELPTAYTYSYADYGFYDVTYHFSNNVSYANYTFRTQVGRNISELELVTVPLTLCTTYYEEVNFQVKAKGSRVRFTLDFEDSSSPSEFNRTDSGDWAVLHEQSIKHTYYAPGEYTAQLTGKNLFGEESIALSHSVAMQHAILGISLVKIEPIPLPPGTLVITLKVENYDIPTDATCDFDYGNGNTEKNVPAVFIGNEFTHSHSYDFRVTYPGELDIAVNCSNCVSKASFAQSIWLQEPIAYITICMPVTYYTFGDLTEFQVKMENGSHVTIQVFYDSNSANADHEEYVDIVPHVVSLNHTYPEGCFRVKVNASNLLDSQITMALLPVCIQHPIVSIDMTTNSPFIHNAPSDQDGEVCIHIPTGVQGPTDAYCNCTVYDGAEVQGSNAGSLRNNVQHCITASYDYSHIGAQEVCCTCYNFISSMMICKSVEVSEVISGAKLSADPLHVRVDDPVIFTCSVESGSNVTAELEFGDDSDISSKEFPNLLANTAPAVFTHSYSSPGFYNVCCIVRNNLNSVAAECVEVVAEYELLDVEISANNVTRPGEIVSFVANQKQLNEPSYVDITWDYGNTASTVERMVFTSTANGPEHQHDYTYPEYGLYDVNVTLRNNISSLWQTFVLHCGVFIEGVTVHVENKDVQAIHQNACFAVHVDQGSRVNYTIECDNGDVTPVHTRADNGWEAPDDSTIYHIFMLAGDFLCKVCAQNLFDRICVDLGYTINIEDRIDTEDNIVDLATHPLPPGDINVIIKNTPGARPPTDAVCNYTYGDGEADGLVRMWPQASGDYEQPHQYRSGIMPGERAVNCCCANKVSEKCYNTTVMLHEPIRNITAHIAERFMCAETNGTICVSTVNGSHITYDVNFGSPLYPHNRTFIAHPPRSEDLVCFQNRYLEGNFTVSITVSNDISEANYTIEQPFVVQQPITRVTVIAEHAIAFPPGSAMFIVAANTGPSAPTDVFCRWRFTPLDSHEQISEMFYGPALRASTSYVQTKNYDRPKLGMHDVRVNCSNYCSSQTKTIRIWVDEVISGFKVVISSMHVKTGDPVTFTFCVKNGTSLFARMDLTSPNTVRSKGPDHWPVFDANTANYTFTETFQSADNFTCIFKVKNNISEAIIEPSEKVIVQNPVQQFTLRVETPYPHNAVALPPGEATFFISPDPDATTRGTTVFVHYESPDDGSQWTTYSIALGEAGIHQETHHFTSRLLIGDHPIEVMVKNDVSNISDMIYIHVEEVIHGVNLQLSDTSVEVGKDSCAQISCANGSHVSFMLDWQDGSPIDVHPDNKMLCAESPIELCHSYINKGNLTVHVKAYNNVSEEEVYASHEIVVQDIIVNSSLIGPRYVSLPTGGAVFTITTATLLGENIENAHIHWSVGSDLQYKYFHQFTHNAQHLPYQFDGSVLGDVLVTANVSNLVSWSISTFSTYIQKMIYNAYMNVSQVATAVNEKVTFTAITDDGTDLVYNISYGDGTMDICVKPNSSYPCIFEHKYIQAKNYTVYLTVANAIDRDEYYLPDQVIIQNIVRHDELVLSCDPVIPNPPGKLTLTLANKADTPDPSPMTLYIDYNDGQTQTPMFVPQLPFSIMYTYSSSEEEHQLGKKNVQLNLTNLVSTGTFNKEVQLQEMPIMDNLTHIRYASVGERVRFICHFRQGSDQDVQLEFGDGNKNQTSVSGKTRNVTIVHAYSEPGLYSVMVVFRNLLPNSENMMNFPLAIEVQYPVENIELQFESPIQIAADSPEESEIASFTLIKLPGAHTPSNTTIKCVYGDELEDEYAELISPLFTWEHVYTLADTYTVQICVVNNISDTCWNTTVIVEAKITDCDFSIQLGSQWPVLKIPVSALIVLRASISSGSNVIYRWSMNEDVIAETNATDTEYSFTQVGFPHVQLQCSNLVSQESQIHRIEVFSPIDISFVRYEQNVEVEANVTIKVSLIQAIDAVCLLFEFTCEEDTLRFWWGDLGSCQTDPNFQIEQYAPVVPKGVEYEVVYTFYAIGDCNATFCAFNAFAKKCKEGFVSVQAIACNPPQMVAKEGRTVNETQRYKRSQTFTITTSAFVVTKGCMATDEYNTTLALEYYQETEKFTGWVKSVYTNPLDDGSGNVRGWLIEEKLLDYGQYRINYTLEPKGFPEYRNSSVLYFFIDGSHMTTCLNKLSKDVIGMMTPYELTTLDCTTDPDNDPRPFSYEWYCGTEAEMKNITFDELDEAELFKIPQDKPTQAVSTDQVGCFGSPAGRIDVDARMDSITFNTGHYVANRTYVWRVRVRKGERVTEASLSLKVTEGKPPKFTAECYEKSDNCQWNALKINAKKPFQIIMHCENCLEGSVPSLDLALVRHGEPYDAPVDSSTLVNLEDGAFLWTQDLTSFTEIGYYEMEVTIHLVGFPDGFLSYKFAINGEPYGGSIVIVPPAGTQFDEDGTWTVPPWTELIIRAVDWKDDGAEVISETPGEEQRKKREALLLEDLPTNQQDLTFSFSYIKMGNEVPLFGEPVMLPEGDPSEDYLIEIVVEVRDNYGAVVFYSEFFKVQGDPNNEDAQAQKEAVLDDIMNTNLSQTTDVIGALSKVVTAVTEISTPPDAPTDAEEDEQEATEEARQNEIAEQERLAKVMTGLVDLATSDTTDPATIQATFKAYAVVVKKQKGSAPTSMKIDSLTIASSFLASLQDGEDQGDLLKNVIGALGDALGGALAEIPRPPPIGEDDIPDEGMDETILAANDAEREEQEKGLARKAADNFEESSRSITDKIKSNIVIDGDELMVGDQKLSVTVAITSLQRVNGSILTTGGSEVIFPALDPILDNSVGGKEFAIFFQITYSEVNVFAWDKSAGDVNNGVTVLHLTNQDGQALEFAALSEPLKVDMAQTEASDNWANMNNMTVDQQSSLVYMYVPVDVEVSAFIMELDVNAFETSENLYFEVFFKFGAKDTIVDRPNRTQGTYDLMREVPDTANPLAWVIIVAEAFVQLPGIYIGVLPRVRNSTTLFNQSNVPAFNMRSSLPRCRAWDMAEEIWSGKSCSVGRESSIDNTRCECGELNRQVRTYSGGISVPKVNTIDFSKVFANFSALLAANPVVLATVLVILTIYILILVWARRADERDRQKWCVTPLVDNPLDCPHVYKVSVYTGLRQGAGTKSKVCFIVSGDRGDTGVRVMDDGQGKNFERGTLRHFLMTTEQSLGELSFVRIWHDNSGDGGTSNWFLDKVVVEDIIERKRYFFLCGRWLAVDEDDGQVDRMLTAALHEEIDGFNHIFFSKTRHKLTDDHLWISVLSRPTKSTFTRAQRLTCCLALLSTTMVANAMFYGSADSVENDQMIRIGPVVLSTAVLLVSIFSSLIVVPFNMVLVQLFRKSRPKHLERLPDGSEVRTNKQGQRQIAGVRRISVAERGHRDPRGDEYVGDADSGDEDGDNNKKGRKTSDTNSYWFPWWCNVLAWVLAIMASLASLFFVLLYSLDWGRLKSEEWLSALLMSFFQSVLVIQPIKVIVVAMFLSLIFKKFDEEKEELPVQPTSGPGSEEYDEVMHIDRQMFLSTPMAPNKRKLEKARRQREHERKMKGILVECFTYFLYLLLVAFIAFGTYDLERFLHAKHLQNLLHGPRKNESVHSVSNYEKLWKYLDEVVSDVMFNIRDYTGALTIRSDRRYISDGVNIRVGDLRLRQLRVQPADCETPDIARNIIIECNSPYDIMSEQSSNYSLYWLELPENHTDPAQLSDIQMAFRYKGILELKGLPVLGKMALYNGGGYVANLGTSTNKARSVLQQLMEHYWIDYYTRAVILEFIVYNGNANLFGHVQYLFEIPPTGGIVFMPLIRSFPVYSVFTVMGTVVVTCQILYVLILLYFIVRETRKMLREGYKIYFQNMWNIYEWCVIVISIIGVGMFGAGEAAGRLVTKELNENKDGFTHYERLALYQEAMVIVVGIIVFMSNLRFLRLMRLNRHVIDLYHTIVEARRELMYFGVTFFVIFFAYVLPSMLLFGKHIYQYSTVWRALSGCYNILLGKLFWKDLLGAAPVMGPIFFVSLIMTVFFVLINMFVSILTSAFNTVRLRPDREKESDVRVFAYVGKQLSGMLWCCGPSKTRDRSDDYSDNLESLDNRVNYINDMINTYYKDNIKISAKGTKELAYKVDTSNGNEPGSKKKNMLDMFHF